MSMIESGGAHSATPPQQAASVRAQILATEHWSLLAARSMTWSEIMSRIVIHLTLLSASLVVLALVAQTAGFGLVFRVFAIGLAAGGLVLGSLTELRVYNASADDTAMLIGMNRLRSAYVDMDPEVEQYFVTSRYDDAAGVMASYLMGQRRSMSSHVLGSTAMFINVVNAIVAGTFGALVAEASGAPAWLIAVVGALCGLAYVAGGVVVGKRRFGRNDTHEIRFPTPQS
jgi:hypothetical protein